MIHIKGLTQQQVLIRLEKISTLTTWFPVIGSADRIIKHPEEYSNNFLDIVIYYYTNQIDYSYWEPSDWQKFLPFSQILKQKLAQIQQLQRQQMQLYQQQLIAFQIQYQQNSNQNQNNANFSANNFQANSGYPYNNQQGNYNQNGNFNHQANYNQANYNQANYNQANYNQANYNQANFNQTNYQQQTQYNQAYGGQAYYNQNQGHGYQKRNNNQRGNNQYRSKPNYQSNSHNYNNQYTHKIQEQQTASFIPIPVQQPIVEQPKPEPPRPAKFSILEIKDFIKNFEKVGNKNLTPELVESVQKMNRWKSTKETVDIQTNQPPQKMKSNKSRTQTQGDFKKGGAPKRDDAIKPGNQFKKSNDEVEIVFGKNETLAMRMKKREIQAQSQSSFATESHKIAMNLDEFQKQKRQIIFNLNLLAPENLRDIEADIEKYLYDEEKVCRSMIEEIIEKAWVQPKYSGTYAKLCQDFCKAPTKNFNYTLGDEKKGSNNPFKYILVENVQKTFNSKSQELVFESQDQKNKYLANKKKKIIGNVKFIAELIRIKVLAKRIAKFCISHLITTFLANHAYFNKLGKFTHSYYDFYIEAAIEFIQNIGDKFQSLDETKQKGEKSKKELPEKKEVDNSQVVKNNFALALKIIEDLINEIVPELGQPIPQLPDLTPDAYFRILMTIDNKILSKKSNRLSSLLKNLEARRDNGWQKHFVEAQGPKKLKDIKEEIAREQNETTSKIQTKTKSELEALNDDMQKMLDQYQNDDKGWQKLFKKILEHSSEDVMMSYLKLVAEEKKNYVGKRLEVFPLLMEKKFKIQDFKKVWKKIIQNLAFMSSDLPYCGASLAKILIMIDEKRGIRLNDFYHKFDQEEEEDEKWFMDQVFDKLYFYTKKEEIKDFVEVSKNPSNMI